MKNLRIQGQRILQLQPQHQDENHNDDRSSSSPLVDVCPVNSTAEGSVDYVVLSENGNVCRISTCPWGSVQWSTNLSSQLTTTTNATSAAAGGGGGWFNLSLVETNLLVALNSTMGAIVSLDLSSGEAELVGEFENGIFAAAWSPDGEVLVLITTVPEEGEEEGFSNKDGKRFVLLSMNAHWDVLAEVDIEPCCETESITICWRPSDATLLAVSSVDPADHQRKIRMYKRETLALHAIGRTEDGSGTLAPNLLPALSWAGSGCSQLLATIQRKGKKQQVAFLEPNGLRHGQFLLCSDEMTVLHLDWNIESDLLAVCLRDNNASPGGSRDKVQLWHRSNYHWYLKQELHLGQSGGGGGVTSVKFHPELPYTLLILESTQCGEYRVQWAPSTVAGPNATAFVVDGSQLNLTPFETAVIPPPMCATSISLSCPITQVLATRTVEPVIAVVVHSDGSLAWIESSTTTTTTTAINCKTSYVVTPVTNWSTISDGGDDDFDLDWRLFLRDYCIVGGTADEVRLLAVEASTHDTEKLVELVMTKDQVQVIERIPLEGRVLNVTAWSDSSEGALIQLEDGQLLEYEYPGSVVPSEAEPFLEPCSWTAALKNVSRFDDGSHSQRTRLVVGLSSRLRLYCHELLLADSASSFALSTAHEYLCFATSGAPCQLRFLSLTELHNFDPYLGSENYVRQGYEPRNIERGARVVAVLPQKPGLIVQMPRGNLETVYPRALVLRHSVRLIDEGDYTNAFALLRRHRVDLNLMIDLDPVKFLVGCRSGMFLEQILSIDHLNLFISCLQNVDSTKGSFVIPAWWRGDVQSSHDGTQVFDFTTKVNRTCQTLRSIMVDVETNGETRGGRAIANGHFLLPILSTFAKENPPQLEDALAMIKKNALAKHSHASKKPPLFSDAAQSSIQYLAFLADYELLFETALSMYDFDIARAVARNSQMDPKVYIPLLKRYRDLPENFARFEVDTRLKRYESALRHLHMSNIAGESPIPKGDEESKAASDGGCYNAFDACMRLVEEHHLYRLGLELFQEDREKRSRIMLSLGDYLLQDCRDPAAALSVFLVAASSSSRSSSVSGVDFKERASNAARQCRDWRTFFSLSALATNDPSAVSEDSFVTSHHHQQSLLARGVADELTADAEGHLCRRQMLVDAAQVLLDYGGRKEEDVAAAVDFLILGELWSEGKRIAQLHGRSDLVRKCTDAAVSYAHSAVNDLQERSESFCATIIRYSEARRMRIEAIARGEDPGDDAENELEDDSGSLFSLAASQASNLTMASNTSRGSTTSVVSSVISVKSSSTFSVTGNEERNRHKSKYNMVGDRRIKKKKKKGKGRTKVLPGSEQELQGLLQNLRFNCIDENYRKVLAETITYLLQNSHVSLANTLYNGYVGLSKAINKAQSDRRSLEDVERLEGDREARKAEVSGRPSLVVLQNIERELDSLSCANLPEELNRLFSFLPGSFY